MPSASVISVLRRFRPSYPNAWMNLLILQAVWLVSARLWVGVGWGWTDKVVYDGVARPGWMTNLPDSLSYASWMEQARNGSVLAQLLYTTSPHPHVYFNPVLWCAGTLSRFFGGAPTGWLNLAALGAALLCTALVHAIALRLDLGPRAAFWSAAITAFGSGCSWISILLSKLCGFEAIRGADLRFMDLLPSSAALVYPFHTIGFAMVAALWWLTLRLEQSFLPSGAPSNRPVGPWWWLLTAGVAALLSASRPYEPAAFLGVYVIYTLAALGPERQRPISLLRLRISFTLALGAGPGLLYSMWLSSKPVWREFAALSMNLGHPRSFWLLGFGGLWLLAVAGLPRLFRGGNSPRYLPAFWCLFLILWLPVLNSSMSKLAAGGGLALALAAGPALAAGIEWFKPPRRPALAGGFAFVIAGPISLFALLRESTLFPPQVDATFAIIARQLRPAPGSPVPTVLCEFQAGAALPGIGGLRVVCGHWSLTDHYEKKRQWLVEAGLESTPPSGRTLGQQMAKLRALAATEGCDHLLLSDRRPVAALVAAEPSFAPLPSPAGWRLYRILNPSQLR